MLGGHVRGDAGDADLVDVPQPHVQVLGDVVVGAAGDEAQFECAEVEVNPIRKCYTFFNYKLAERLQAHSLCQH